MSGATTRVLLADDHVMVREALARLLEETRGIEVVAQAGDGGECLRLAQGLGPDVVVLDYSMPGTDTPLVVRSLRQALPEAKVLILTVHENVHYALKSLESGAHGYVIKSSAASELIDAIRAVRAGDGYVSPLIADRVKDRLEAPRKRATGLEALSPREFALLRALAAGKSLKQCAGELGIGVTTAATYRSRLLDKLGLDSTAAVIRLALENGVTG